ncbi:MAG: polyribonucleotide nucleotidyltransferase [Saprospiraceae bacterium]
MGNLIPLKTSFNLPDGREVTLETGKLATQADGSVVVRLNNTMILATVVSAYEAKDGQSFFPLSVDYQEKFAAAGRIPGNFFRRETRLNDYEILICRLVDRAIRPLFPDGYMNETQVILTLISSDPETMPDALAALAASAALAVSNIPWDGPISEVRVARINGQWQVNPERTALKEADIDIIVGATLENVTMVEGEMKECSEAELIEGIKVGHEAIKTQINAQLQLAALVGEKATVKRVLPEAPKDADVEALVESLCKEGFIRVAKSALDKGTRKAEFKVIKESLKAQIKANQGEEYYGQKSSLVDMYFDKIKKKTVRQVVLDTGVRLDGRATDQIRPIWSEVDYLPSTHGSAIFNRGETQALASLTLGTKLDQQMIDTSVALSFDKFILHYNFPGFSVGEVKPQRGPGRREVGHANLAARSLKMVMPKDYPYTIRLVSDILESNGSSSMATVCSSSLALMDAGVPIRSAVSGIAMGLITDGKNYAILSDILGDEDALGDMDFKVTGTENGICGCQMDIKIDGLPYEVMERALIQARAGRIHILGKMAETLSQANDDLKPHAPRMVELVIEKSFIGAVIGPGGSIIQKMQEETGTTINIEEVDGKGIVQISSNNKESIDKAVARITDISFSPEVGDVFESTVASIMPYGAFVDFRGKSGLLHVSEISHNRVDNVEDVLKVGDKIKVKLLELDKKTGKFRLSAKVLIPRPERKPNSSEE